MGDGASQLGKQRAAPPTPPPHAGRSLPQDSALTRFSPPTCCSSARRSDAVSFSHCSSRWRACLCSFSDFNSFSRLELFSQNECELVSVGDVHGKSTIQPKTPHRKWNSQETEFHLSLRPRSKAWKHGCLHRLPRPPTAACTPQPRPGACRGAGVACTPQSSHACRGRDGL